MDEAVRGREPAAIPFAAPAAAIDEFRLAIDAIPGLVWIARPDGFIDFLNRRWCDYTGLTPEQARGWGWQHAIHPDDVAPLRRHWLDVLASAEEGETQARLRRSDGEYRWFLFRAVPLRDGDGRVARWYGQTIDVHEQQRTAALLDAERRLLELVAMGEPLATLLDALCRTVEALEGGSYCSILLVEPDGRHMRHAAAPSLSAGYVQATDGAPVGPDHGPCGAAAFLKRPIVVTDFDDDARWDARYLAQMRLHGLRAGWSTPIFARAGAVLGTFAIYFRTPGSPAPAQFHLVERFTHVASIAIERANADRALQRSEAHLATAQRLSATGSFSWHVGTGEVAWSNEVYRIYGVDGSAAPGLGMARERVHPDDVAHFDEVAALAVREGRDLDFGHRLLLPNGSVKHVHVMAAAVPAGDGGTVQYFGAVRDVTERRRADDALSAARAELARVARVATLGELTASIAHEVNQPLTGVVTNGNACLRWLANDPPDVAQADEAARRIIRDAQRAADVIVRLRALFQKAEPTRRALDVNDVLRDALALAEHEVRRHDVSLRTALAPALPAVRGDRVQLQQVVLNLLVNAVESLAAAERPREIVLATDADGAGGVRVTVSDTGAGLAGQDPSRIFDAFHTTKPGGMGMGLSIARSIVESHGGALWAEAGEGRGARFAFTLPGRAGG